MDARLIRRRFVHERHVGHRRRIRFFLLLRQRLKQIVQRRRATVVNDRSRVRIAADFTIFILQCKPPADAVRQRDDHIQTQHEEADDRATALPHFAIRQPPIFATAQPPSDQCQNRQQQNHQQILEPPTIPYFLNHIQILNISVYSCHSWFTQGVFSDRRWSSRYPPTAGR